MANFVLRQFTSASRKYLKYVHTSANLSGNERIMKKILGASSKKKKHRYSDSEILPSPDIFNKNPLGEKKSGTHRRMIVLNKLFMRHITDLMATGECAPELLGHGIEVNRVKVTPDYNTVRIYWVARASQNDDIIDELLQKNAGKLRHELSQLQVMGVVPRLIFVKDKEYAALTELDARLARADFGEDHEPLNLADKLKSQLELYTELDEETKKKIQETEDHSEEDIEPSLPPMIQDILGLNHADILNRVKKQMKKSEALHRISSNKNNPEEVTNLPINTAPVDFLNSTSERAAFKEFLSKRQQLQSKLKRAKNYSPDLVYIQEELGEKSAKYLDSILEEYESEEKDYIVEDDGTGEEENKPTS